MTQQFKPSLAPGTDEQSPLRRFNAVLQEYVPDQRTSGAGKPYMIVSFKFTDVDPIETTEPYNFPVATLEIFYNERADNDWDVWKKSVVGIIPSRDIDLLVGKKQQWALLPARTNQPDENSSRWTLQDAMCWQVVSVEGFITETGDSDNNTGSLEDALLELVEGKNDADFLQAFYEAGPELRDMAEFEETSELISQREFLPALAASGQLSQDVEGIWHKS